MADDDFQRAAAFSTSSQAQWSPNTHIYPHSHHGTPAQEYQGFSFGPPQPIVEGSSFIGNAHQQQRPVQPGPPLVMPPWPSMLPAQPDPAYQAMFAPTAPAFQPIRPMPIAPTVIAGPSSSSRSSSTPRKTLTDQDRKRMCQYAEDHPTSKQTEIGAIFGVERSTVSKVLRQKEKYLFQDDGSRSPIKRAKGRSPDVERALAVWAKNQERKGLPLTDDLIRDKARAFSATTATPENNVATSSMWLEKFKLKNNLMGARSRRSSLAPDDSESNVTMSPPQPAIGTSPTSSMAADTVSPTELLSVRSEDLKNEDMDGNIDFFSRQPLHSQSTTSLSSAFTDAAASSFSPGPLSPTTSSFFTPDSGVAPSVFTSPSNSRLTLTSGSSNAQRPRSQTFPLLDTYLLPGSNADIATPKYAPADILDAAMEEPDEHGVDMVDVVHTDVLNDSSTIESAQQPVIRPRPRTIAPAESMGPPPLPTNIASSERKRSITPATSTSSAVTTLSTEEARNALILVVNYFEQQPQGLLDLHESVTLGKLMEKLKLPV